MIYNGNEINIASNFCKIANLLPRSVLYNYTNTNLFLLVFHYVTELKFGVNSLGFTDAVIVLRLKEVNLVSYHLTSDGLKINHLLANIHSAMLYDFSLSVEVSLVISSERKVYCKKRTNSKCNR